MKRILCLVLLILPCLYGCVHYVPREDRIPEESTAEATTAAVTLAPVSGETTEARDPEPYPNEAEGGYTKRY